MKITILTLFPEMFEGFLQESIVKRAQEKNAVEINIVQLRDYAIDVHGTVDDRPYGGGAGMVLMAEPVVKALQDIGSEEAHVLMTSPRGKVYKQEHAQEYAGKEHVIIIAGHYEAPDERIMNHVDEEISIGDYVLTGGELPAAVIVDSIVRLLSGVLKKEDATEIESFYSVSVEDLEKAVGDNDIVQRLINERITHVQLLEYPHYTRPQTFEGHEVPEVLLSGDHAAIQKWHIQQSFELTKKRRPDLFT